MVSLVFGNTGSGKTTFLAWCAWRAQMDKRLQVGCRLFGGYNLQDCRHYSNGVYSNFPLKGCKPISGEDLGKFDIQDSLILLDEASLEFDCRDFKTFSRDAKYFFTHNRHYNCDIILASQDAKDCDRKIRNLAHALLLIKDAGLDVSRVTPIHRYCEVARGDIDSGFELGGKLSSMRLLRRKYYSMFDTAYKPKALEKMPFRNIWGGENGGASPVGEFQPVAAVDDYTQLIYEYVKEPILPEPVKSLPEPKIIY